MFYATVVKFTHGGKVPPQSHEIPAKRQGIPIMSMKTASAPRRIYTRNDVVHVCFAGKYFGPTGESELSLDHPVTLEPMESDGGRARVQVVQKRKGQPTVTETWRSINVPRKVRAA